MIRQPISDAILHDDAVRRRARQHLKSVDPIMARTIDRLGDGWKRIRKSRFELLAGAILSQQISTKAADTIRRRLMERLGGKVRADTLLSLSDGEYRAAGVSRQKISYLRHLSELAADGSLRLAGLHRLSDEDVIDRLCIVKGIGKWSAEMFLMFSLGRTDILSTADLGLQTGARELYGLDARPTHDEFVALGQPWRPYRSLASWYLWEHLRFPDSDRDLSPR